MLPSCADQDWNEKLEFTSGFERLTTGQGVDLDALLEEVDTKTADFAPLLKLPVPARSLTEYWASEE